MIIFSTTKKTLEEPAPPDSRPEAVQELHATESAFAALRVDGSVCTWGGKGGVGGGIGDGL